MRRHTAVRRGAAEAELRTFAEPLLCGVVLDDLRVRAAVLDQRGHLQQCEDVMPVYGAVAACLPVDDKQALGVAGQPEERLLPAQFAPPEIGPGDPAEGGADTGGEHPEDDVAYVVSHGRAC